MSDLSVPNEGVSDATSGAASLVGSREARYSPRRRLGETSAFFGFVAFFSGATFFRGQPLAAVGLLGLGVLFLLPLHRLDVANLVLFVLGVFGGLALWATSDVNSIGHSVGFVLMMLTMHGTLLSPELLRPPFLDRLWPRTRPAPKDVPIRRLEGGRE